MAHASSLASRLERAPVRVSKWNAPEVRVALDDLVAKYLVEDARYTETHAVVHRKLAASAVLAAVGAAVGLYSWLVPFERAWPLTAAGAGAYIAVLAAYSYWLAVCVPRAFFRGVPPTAGRRGDAAVWLASRLDLPAGRYRLAVLSPVASGRRAAARPASMRPADLLQCAVDSVLGRLPGAVVHDELGARDWCVGEWIRDDGVVDGRAFCASMDAFRASVIDRLVSSKEE